jgi:hypothetical protein
MAMVGPKARVVDRGALAGGRTVVATHAFAAGELVLPQELPFALCFLHEGRAGASRCAACATRIDAPKVRPRVRVAQG